MFSKIKILLFILMISMVSLADDYDIIKNKKVEISEIEIEEYWERLKVQSDKLFKGLDINFDVSVGAYQDEDNEQDYKGEIKVTVPLFSKEEKIKKQNEKMTFLDKGADLINELEINIEKIKILKEKENIFKTIMMEEGIKSIDAYHNTKLERKKVEADIDKIIKKLEVMLM